MSCNWNAYWNNLKFAYICSWGFTVFSLFFSASSVSRTTCRLLWLTTSNCQLWATGSYGKCLEAFWHEKVCLQHGQHWHSLNGLWGWRKTGSPLQPPKSSGVSLFPRLDAVKVPLEKLQMDRQTLAPFSCNGIRSSSPCETWPMWWNISIGSDRQFPSWNFHPRLA